MSLFDDRCLLCAKLDYYKSGFCYHCYELIASNSHVRKKLQELVNSFFLNYVKNNIDFSEINIINASENEVSIPEDVRNFKAT